MAEDHGHSPLQQFEIARVIHINVGGVDVSFTNSSVVMAIAVILIVAFMILSVRRRALVPGRWQSLSELSYEFVGNMIRDNVGKEGLKFFPFVFTIFMFVLFGNLLGLVPYAFTFTSHIAVTGALAFLVITVVTVVGLAMHGLHFFSLFAPKGVPVAMMPLMVPIEIISYFSRPVSLAIRLFANMMAGHTMMKVFAGFVITLGAATYGIGGIAPIAMNVALTGFELLVAFLQAYVFTVLTCLYLNDAIHLH